MYGRLHETTTVRSSTGRTSAMARSAGSPNAGRSGSRTTWDVKTRSSASRGMPSCHCAPERIFQVVSIVPSGETIQRPFSTEGSDSARRGRATPAWSWIDSPTFTSASIALTPAMAGSASLLYSTGGSPLTTAIMRDGAEGCEAGDEGRDGLLGAQLTSSSIETTKRTDAPVRARLRLIERRTMSYSVTQNAALAYHRSPIKERLPRVPRVRACHGRKATSREKRAPTNGDLCATEGASGHRDWRGTKYRRGDRAAARGRRIGRRRRRPRWR